MVAGLRSAGIPHRFVHYEDHGNMRLTDDVTREMLTFIAEDLEKPLN